MHVEQKAENVFVHNQPQAKLSTIKKRSQFASARSKGEFFSSKGIMLQVVKLDNIDGKLHYGITVSKKISKLAVERNKIKRRFRELIRNIGQDNLDTQYYYILIAGKHTLKRSFSDLQKDMKYLLHAVEKME